MTDGIKPPDASNRQGPLAGMDGAESPSGAGEAAGARTDDFKVATFENAMSPEHAAASELGGAERPDVNPIALSELAGDAQIDVSKHLSAIAGRLEVGELDARQAADALVDVVAAEWGGDLSAAERVELVAHLRAQLADNPGLQALLRKLSL